MGEKGDERGLMFRNHSEEEYALKLRAQQILKCDIFILFIKLQIMLQNFPT